MAAEEGDGAPQAMCLFCEHPIDLAAITDGYASVLTQEMQQHWSLTHNKSQSFLFACTSSRSCQHHGSKYETRMEIGGISAKAPDPQWRKTALVQRRTSRGGEAPASWFASVHPLSQPSKDCRLFWKELLAEEEEGKKEEAEKAARMRATSERAKRANAAAEAARQAEVTLMERLTHAVTFWGSLARAVMEGVNKLVNLDHALKAGWCPPPTSHAHPHPHTISYSHRCYTLTRIEPGMPCGRYALHTAPTNQKLSTPQQSLLLARYMPAPRNDVPLNHIVGAFKVSPCRAEPEP